MNMFKNNGGFTLVELIVVIAILAILAAVAVPAYTGYIEKAEEAAVIQQLSPVNTAAQGLAAAEGVQVIKIEVGEGADPTVVVTTQKGSDAAVTTLITKEKVENLTGDLVFDATFKGATMENNKWTVK